MPNMRVFRPADAIETAECWQLALERTDGPTVLALTRQNLTPARTTADRANLAPTAPTRSRRPSGEADGDDLRLRLGGGEWRSRRRRC